MKDVLKESCVIADLRGGTKEEVLTELVSSLKGAGLVQDVGQAVGVILEPGKAGEHGYRRWGGDTPREDERLEPYIMRLRQVEERH